MAERNPAAYLGGGADYAAVDDRLVLAALFGSSAPLTPKGGVVPAESGTPLRVTAGAGLAVSVAAGQAVIPSSELGVYVVTNDAPVNRAIPPADIASPRTDIVVARVYDADAGDPELTPWAIEVVPGVPAALPLPAEVPANALLLAMVLVPAGSNGSNMVITDWRKMVTGLGNTGKSTPRGVVALDTTPLSGAIGSVNQAFMRQVTFDFQAGRLYRVAWDVTTVDGETGAWDASYTAQSAARLYLRYAIGSAPDQNSPQTTMGGLKRVAVFGESSGRCAGGLVVGYLHDLADGAEVHVGAFAITEVAGYNTRVGDGTLEVADVGTWPPTQPT